MPSYELAPQVDTYYGNPGNPPAPLAPCADPEVTPQKVCGTFAAPTDGETVEVDWVQLNHTNTGTNSAQPLSPSTLLVRRAMLSAPATNSVSVNIGPNSNANADAIGSGQFGYEIPMPDGTAFDLNLWYSKASAANQNLIILYLPG